MADKRVNETSGSEIIFELASNSKELAKKESAKYVYVAPKVTEDYQKKYIEDKAPIYRQVQSVVVSQDPKLGQVVPAGTEVKLVLASKSTIPVATFLVGKEFQAKYGKGDVEVILKDLDEKGELVKPILEQQKAYEELTSPEKNAIMQYAQAIGLGAGAEIDPKSTYEDASFFFNF
jgi:hypothetical protein